MARVLEFQLPFGLRLCRHALYTTAKEAVTAACFNCLSAYGFVGTGSRRGDVRAVAEPVSIAFRLTALSAPMRSSVWFGSKARGF